MTTYFAKGYEGTNNIGTGHEGLIQRKSDKKIFTWALMYSNNGGSETFINASFHVSLQKAEAEARTFNKRSHLQVIAIVPAIAGN